MTAEPALEIYLRTLRLPSVAACHRELAEQATQQSWSFSRYLYHCVEAEVQDRKTHRIERNLKRSGLPHGKTIEAIELDRWPPKVRKQLPNLIDGSFVEKAENILVFGNPGTGKSHLVAALGHELVRKGFQVLFIPTFRLVQQLLVAKRDLLLERTLKRLDIFDAVILDDIGYVQQDREEMEVLFTFLAERYERRSVIITSNLVFSQWDRIFKDTMTTAAAIDRIVHHATIIELVGDSFRATTAKGKLAKTAKQADEKEAIKN